MNVATKRSTVRAVKGDHVMRKKSSIRWTAMQQRRLIELFQLQRPLEEIARELSLPIDEIEKRVQWLQLESDIPYSDYL